MFILRTIEWRAWLCPILEIKIILIILCNKWLHSFNINTIKQTRKPNYSAAVWTDGPLYKNNIYLFNSGTFWLNFLFVARFPYHHLHMSIFNSILLSLFLLSLWLLLILISFFLFSYFLVLSIFLSLFGFHTFWAKCSSHLDTLFCL